MKPALSTSRIVVATLLAAAGLVFVGWFDYSATRRELLSLLRGQAAALRQTVAAAAQSNEAAGQVASSQVAERLLDNARLLAQLDSKGNLTRAFLAQTAEQNKLFRVAVFGPDGTREDAAAGSRFPPGMGPGMGGRAGGGRMGGGRAQPGRGMGMGPGVAFVEPILSGRQTEVVGALPGAGRRAARVAAAVRRSNGGAILVNADASEIESLLRQVSLDRLIEKIAVATPQLAYIVLDRGDTRYARGHLPESLPQTGTPPRAESGSTFAERTVGVEGRPVLELSSPVVFGEDGTGELRLGLWMDEVRAAERRMLTRMAVSLAAALLLSIVALGAVWLRQAYGALSEKHARAEAALRRRDRLSAMGELASTVAHEVRNPLNAIAMSAQRLRREFVAPVGSEAERAEVAELLGVMEGETSRINDIVQQFLVFARPPRLAPAPVALGPEIQALVDAARPLARTRDVSLEADVAAAGEAVVDAGQLRQAVGNLLRNAVEATPPGGRVEVAARTGAREHTISVRDTGGGIAPDDLPKIFDLYFTTKPEGTGIGLAVTQQIVSAHGGTIEVDSKPGAGTTMTIRLPADAEDGANHV